MGKYKCIFFDLDHTLWDYETSSRETLQELYSTHNLCEKGVTDFNSFLLEFKRVNAALWELYDTGKIGGEVIREERFKQILAVFGLTSQALINDLSGEYLHTCPKKGNLMPNTLETLQYLSGKYRLTIITNGFEEIQNIKLKAGNLHSYFDHIITSQGAGHKKPAREIFDFALEKNKIASSKAIMIGDNLITDIAGARKALIDTVLYNPTELKHEEEVSEIRDLNELCTLL